ncbi:MAG: hypothetical protein U0Q07_17515 [Acidimicrobiales bacterium]
MTAGGPGLPTPPGTVAGPAGATRSPGTPPRAPMPAPPPASAGPVTQVAAFVTVSLAVGAVAAAAHDPTLVGFGVGGLFVGVCFGLGLRLDGLFRALPGWFLAVALTCTLGLGWVVVAPGSAAASVVVLPTVLLLVTGLDWARAARLRTVALLSGLLAVPVVATADVVALLVGLGWFLAALATCWAAQADLRAALPRPRAARPTSATDLAPSTPGELVRLASLAAVGALALALLIGTPSCDPQGDRDAASQAGSGRGAGGQTGGQSGSGQSGGQSGGQGGGQSGGRVGGGGAGGQGGGGQGGSGQGGSGSAGRAGPSGGTSSGGGTGPGAGGTSSGSSSSPGSTDRSSLTALLAVLLLTAALVALALVLWPRRRGSGPEPTDAPPPWARTLVARLDAEGTARGRPRAPGETVVDHAAALAAGPLADPRIAELGWLLSAALFSGREPPPDRQRWAEALLDEVTAANPPPEPATRRGRRPDQRRATPA